MPNSNPNSFANVPETPETTGTLNGSHSSDSDSILSDGAAEPQQIFSPHADDQPTPILNRSQTVPLLRTDGSTPRRLRLPPGFRAASDRRSLTEHDDGRGEPRGGFVPPYTRYPGPTEIHIWFGGDGSQFPDRGPLPEGQSDTGPSNRLSSASPVAEDSQPTLRRSGSGPGLLPTQSSTSTLSLPSQNRRRNRIKGLGKRLVLEIQNLAKRSPSGG